MDWGGFKALLGGLGGSEAIMGSYWEGLGGRGWTGGKAVLQWGPWGRRGNEVMGRMWGILGGYWCYWDGSAGTRRVIGGYGGVWRVLGGLWEGSGVTGVELGALGWNWEGVRGGRWSGRSAELHWGPLGAMGGYWGAVGGYWGLLV